MEQLQHITKLSGMQRYMVEQYISPDNEPWCYHTQLSYHLQIRDLSLPLFFKAVKGVVDRHPVFRTVILFNEENEMLQAINSALDIQIRFANIEHLSESEQSAWMETLHLDDRNRPFDVRDRDQPLFRGYIIKRGKETLQLVLVFMHAIWDGWSLAVFLKEVFTYYQRLATEPTLTLSVAPYEFADFIQHDHRINSDDQVKTFWTQHLAWHRPYTGNMRLDRENYDHYAPGVRVLPSQLSKKLQMMQPRLNCPVRTVFLAMFIRMLEDETNYDHNTVGVVTNGRSATLANPITTLGLLWNIAPLCVERIADDVSHIRNVNKALSETSVFGSYPLLRVQEDTGHSNLLHGAFNFINFQGANLLSADSGIEFLEVGGFDKFNFPLHLLVGKNPFNNDISLILNYDSRLYSGQQVDEKLDAYVKRLEQLAAMNF